MDPLEPWVDAAAVRRMAEQLLAPSELSAVEATPDTGFGAEFVGYATGRERSEVVIVSGATQEPAATPLAAPARVVPALAETPVHPLPPPPPLPPILPAPSRPSIEPAPAPAPEPSPAPGELRGPLLERLGRFREGLVRHTGAQGVFILDREGKPVMDDPAYGKLHFLARSLAQAYRPVQGQAGNVHVKIGSNAVLEVIPVETAFGCLVMGAVLPQPLSTQLVGEIATALRQAATPREAV